MKPQTKEKLYLAAIALLIAACAQFYFTYRYQPAHEVQVYYNQEQELNKEIMGIIRDADEYVYFAIYTFTRNDIKDALLGAKYRGVDVVGVTDKKQVSDIELQGKIINELRKADIPIYEHDHSAIMHLKTVVSEKAYASGSYNWTGAGTNNNDEILEVGKDEGIRKQYETVLRKLVEKYDTN
ncbi:MAG: phospholipase D-like domain-containing protein [Patescibacteria group bacterium]